MSVFFKHRHTHIHIDTLPSVVTCKSCGRTRNPATLRRAAAWALRATSTPLAACTPIWYTYERKTLSRVYMGWLRLVGALKVQVSFAKEPYKRDDILQKRPIILRRLLIVATPYQIGVPIWYTCV